MSFSAIVQTLRLQSNKHAVPLIGSSETDTSFIGVPANGALNKSLKHITSVKNILSTNQSSNNHNIIFTPDKDWKLILQDYLKTKNSVQLFGRHWQVESWLESITTEFLKEADSIHTPISSIFTIDFWVKIKKKRTYKLWESLKN